ncbi:MAG: glycosyltransferase family 39 protein [Verrucomicrobia bacterium]|nr:glycosyltransferase family 39 protein [Verrucomicrobiota bacterium]
MGLALVLIVALAAGFRLYHLGAPSFRADTMLFFDLCHRPVSGWVIFTQWMELMGRTSQFPFALAITKLFIDVFHLAPTAFMIRLPSALFGIFTVIGMYMLGRQMAGRSFGVILALWMAVNPFHIQLSREAYFYAPLLLGVTLQAWACLWAYRHRNQRTAFPVRFHLVAQVGFLLMMYSHVSGWWVGALFTPFLGWTLGRRAWREPRARPDFWWWLAVCFFIGLPLLFMAWGLPFFLRDVFSHESKEQTKRIFGERQTPLVSFVWLLLKSASWGATPWRIGFLVVAGGLAVAGLVLNRVRFRRAWMMALFMLVGFLIYYLSLISVETYFGQRHVAYELPLYLSVVAYGVWHVSTIPFVRRMIKSPVWRRVPAYALAGAAVALSLQPAWFCTQLTGKPTPYKEIARWCDTHLPPRTLVLVERWFDPWNELRVHNSTNVYFTFTVPAEPPDVFERYNWPATAKEFFNHFPDAAYLEYSISGRNQMGVVSNVFFARQVTFTNRAGIKLAKIGVAYRDEFYNPATNQLISTIFYNTREDVIRHARERGQTTLVLYDPSWGYVKLWQQLKDFRDWRILEDKAVLDVYNLTLQTNTVTFLIRGMAANGGKRVRFGVLGQADFQNLQLAEWRIEHVPLKPGLNQFVLADALWSVAKIPLLVDRVEVVEEGRQTTDGR